ncbi:helix-turn-helix domain-containing protein [Pedobacter terrae]|uniref:helix-turn-helix domain-containing protein n=1 Tax=Pedobacter terrae TaxID=405671 RepID=UPI002FFBBA2C
MQIEILTREELHRFKSELLAEIKQTIRTDETLTNKQFLRSSEVRKLLNISSGTLQNLRIKGILPYEKIGGIFYYAHADIVQLLGEIGNS